MHRTIAYIPDSQPFPTIGKTIATNRGKARINCWISYDTVSVRFKGQHTLAIVDRSDRSQLPPHAHLTQAARDRIFPALRWLRDTVSYDRDTVRLFIVGALIVDTAAALAFLAIVSL